MRKVAPWIGLFMVLGWSSGASAVPIQWTVAEGGNGHWYDVVDLGSRVAWDDAKTQSEGAGGYLATVTSVEEDFWLRANILSSVLGVGGNERMGPWIGGYQDASSPLYSEPNGGWAWVTGEAWSYTAWGGANAVTIEPNDSPGLPGPEDYLHYYVTGTSGDWFGWNDLGSYAPNEPTNSFIVEYNTNPIPEPSTALLLGIGLVGLASRRRV